MSDSKQLSFVCICATAPPPVAQGLPIHNVSSHNDGLLGTSDQFVAETSTRQHTRHSQETNVHPQGGIRTHNLSRQAVTDLRLRPHGHWDRQETKVVESKLQFQP